MSREAYECLIAVGSRNPSKLNAVRQASKLLCKAKVIGVDVGTGVPSQPVGFREVLLGAARRAAEALYAVHADYGVGIEAGFAYIAGEPVEFQAAAIVDSQEKITVGLSPGFPLPRNWANTMKEQRVELGVLAEQATRVRSIGEKIGLIGFLTNGLISRNELSYLAVVMALVPRLNSKLYNDLEDYKEFIKRLGA